MKIDIANGEILDKFSILTIKLHNIKNQNKLIHIEKEYDYLYKYYTFITNNYPEVTEYYSILKNINEQLWIIEDNIRLKEKQTSFDEEFISLARSVYKLNDERAKIKKEINLLTQSNFIEEKSYYEPN